MTSHLSASYRLWNRQYKDCGLPGTMGGRKAIKVVVLRLLVKSHSIGHTDRVKYAPSSW